MRYVNVNNPSPSPPYTNWATAANVIQDAVDLASGGDEVVVTNGVYSSVVVSKPLTLQGLNGPEATVIDGQGLPSTGTAPRGGQGDWLFSGM